MEYKIRLTRSLSVKSEKPSLWLMPFLQQFYVICRTYSHIKHIWVINN